MIYLNIWGTADSSSIYRLAYHVKRLHPFYQDRRYYRITITPDESFNRRHPFHYRNLQVGHRLVQAVPNHFEIGLQN